MNQQQIATLARQLRAELPIVGRAERVLPNRTLVQLLHRNDTLQLVVGHPDYYPCLEDAQAIAAQFGVADDTDATACIVRIASQDGRSIPVKSLAFAWREDIPAVA